MLRLSPLVGANYLDIEVASVDSYQGREKDYIIMSCVRSSECRGIGFLSDPRRLNVAITRCRYGLIVIGNARQLSRHPLWNALLVHFQSRDCLVEGPLTKLVPCRMRFRHPTRYTYRGADLAHRLAPAFDSSTSTTPTSSAATGGSTQTNAPKTSAPARLEVTAESS